MKQEEKPLATGTVEQGVECILVVTETGERYSFSGPLARDLKVGDRVRIYGQKADLSFCMEGIPAAVNRVEKLN